MSYVFATALALALGMAFPTACLAIGRRAGGVLSRLRAQLAFEAKARRAGVWLAPALRLAHARVAAPLPPTRHVRLVKIADKAA